MPTLKEIQDKVDAALAAKWAHIQERQEAYYTGHGHYFQGFPTHTAKPTNGADVVPNALSSSPADQVESWHDAGFVLPAKLPMRMTINSYECLDGHGYEVVLEVQVKGKQYRRALQHGPETWREHPWMEVIEDGQTTINAPQDTISIK